LGGLNVWDVVELLAVWFITWVFLTAVLLTVDLYIRLRIVRSELENVLRKIEEIKRMNEGHEDP
jgi:uncharacterized membrane protein YciS (DUF1049 family)